MLDFFHGIPIGNIMQELLPPTASKSKATKQMPYITKICKDTVGYESATSMPEAHWNKGSTTTVILKFIEHVTRNLAANPADVGLDPNVFDLIVPWF